MLRKRGLSLKHVGETLFVSETLVKKAPFRLYKTRAVSDRPKRKSKKRKISGS